MQQWHPQIAETKMANQKLCNGNTILAMHLLGPKLHSKCPQWTIDSSTDKNRVEKSDSLFVCGECLWETDAVWDMLGIVEGSSPHWHPHMKANHKTLGHISEQQHRYKPQKIQRIPSKTSQKLRAVYAKNICNSPKENCGRKFTPNSPLNRLQTSALGGTQQTHEIPPSTRQRHC